MCFKQILKFKWHAMWMVMFVWVFLLYLTTINNKNRKGPSTDIIHNVASDEWISRGVFDEKAHCSKKTERDGEMRPKSNMTCQIPNLKPFHPSVMKFIWRVTGGNCNRFKSCGRLVNGTFIKDENVVSATYQAILREDDFDTVLGPPTPVSATKKIKDEFIEIKCETKNGDIVRDFWLQPVPHEHLLQRKAKRSPGIPLNILVVGIDSLSHANARRKLPKLYEYLRNDLGALIFKGLSIVGDGTTEQLAAILSGLGELEQYESRRHHTNPRPVDGWTWIFGELKDHGYITGYSEDDAGTGTFQLRLMGFDNPPTDLYTRPYFLQTASYLQGDSDLCLGARNIAQHQFDYIRDVFDTFPQNLKFLFSFNGLFSHVEGLNEVEKIEADVISLLRDLKGKEQLNNTLLIVMGDHGSRFGEMRKEIQGKLEERLPLFAMIFPPWFSKKFPKLYETLRVNTERLTSWYDLHATFRHMLHFSDLPPNIKHGQSLLKAVPASRTCTQASVPLHWCPCQKWSAVDTSDSHVHNAALAVVEYINSLNHEHVLGRKFCETLRLKSVNYAMIEEPNEKVLTFYGTDDQVPMFKAAARPVLKDYCRYQLQLDTSPNDGTYEATVRYHQGWFIVTKTISRVNKYGRQPECVANELPHLRKFCFCKAGVKY